MLAMVGANFGCFSGTVLRRVAARVVAFAATLLAAAITCRRCEPC